MDESGAETVKPRKPIPPLWFFALLLLSIGLGIYLPVLKFLRYPFSLLGIVPIAIGVVLNLWADSLFKKNMTTVKPHLKPSTLITSGVFRVSRNPMYLGMVLILLGASTCVGSVTAFISPVLFFLISELDFIPCEESVMEDAFGQPYLEYKKRVRRWI